MSPVLAVSVLTALVYGLGATAVLVWLRVRRNRRGLPLLYSTLFAVYLYFVLDVTLFQYQSLIVLKAFMPQLMLQGQTAEASLNLVPLFTLTGADLKTSLLNLLMLVPFGFGLPFLAKVRFGRVTVFAAAFSTLIEVTQFTTGLLAGVTFRVADINDVIFNTAGAMIGYTVFRGLHRFLSRVPRPVGAAKP